VPLIDPGPCAGHDLPIPVIPWVVRTHFGSFSLVFTKSNVPVGGGVPGNFSVSARLLLARGLPLAGNPSEGIKQLYTSDRGEIIWTDTDAAEESRGSPRVDGAQCQLPCPQEIAHAVELAAHTGLRLGDQLRLSWSHIGEDAITLMTGKSKRRREATSLYQALRDVLESIPKRSTTVLTNSRKRLWKGNGFGTAFNRAKIATGLADRDLHFHNLRGTAATSVLCGWTIRAGDR
jgi:integrase